MALLGMQARFGVQLIAEYSERLRQLSAVHQTLHIAPA
jgi:hypothetical protein